jgi:hypothetical protein
VQKSLTVERVGRHRILVPPDPLARREVHHGQPDLDDLVGRARRHRPVPAGGLDVHHVQQPLTHAARMRGRRSPGQPVIAG